jgi:hypothetical protein
MNRIWIVLLLASLAPAHAAEHDFDFVVGTFKSHVRRLQKPLTGSTTWTDWKGTVSNRKVLGGRGNLEEIELDTASSHLEALTLRLYNPATRLWSLYWSNARQGVLARPPSVGGFKDGRGEFYDQETWDGRVILVRHVFSDIKPDSYRFEQAFSADGGKTWEANWIADVTRVPSLPALAGAEDRSRDFDFNLGRWKTHVSRLTKPLTGSAAWAQYDGTAEVTPVWHGRASLLELRARGPAGKLEGMGLRLFDSQAKQWSLNWVNGNDGMPGEPSVGEFREGRGEFVDVEPFDGREIFVRGTFQDVTPTSSRFEQAFSADGGKTWETNWIMTFEKASRQDG